MSHGKHLPSSSTRKSDTNRSVAGKSFTTQRSITCACRIAFHYFFLVGLKTPVCFFMHFPLRDWSMTTLKTENDTAVTNDGSSPGWAHFCMSVWNLIWSNGQPPIEQSQNQLVHRAKSEIFIQLDPDSWVILNTLEIINDKKQGW